MIVSTGNPHTDLYVKNLLSEIFPEYCFTNETCINAVSSIVSDEQGVNASVNINGTIYNSFEEYSDHKNKNLATTCALGKAIISYSRNCGKPLPPYGVLIGVRPFKIASSLLQSMNEDEAIKILSDTYLISKNKIPQLIDAACYDLKFKSEHHRKDCSVYISIPYCPTRCSYCSFISSTAPSKLNMLDMYISNLVEEITVLSEFIKKNSYNIKSVYIGGGTPTVLNYKQLNFLIKAISNSFNLTNIKEFTVEAGRPDTVTADKISVLKEYGVDRVCVNCQTTNDYVLKSIGRGHTRNDFFTAFELVKKYGFKTINTDIIAGLENDTFSSFKSTINEVIALQPENITIHTLCIKKSSDMRVSNKTNILKENIEHFIDFAKNRCISSGYRPYYLYKQKYTIENQENVGYCLDGHESYYNIAVMNEIHSIFGIGAGATTKITDIDTNGKIGHFENYKYPHEYINDKNKMYNKFTKIQEYIDSYN